MALPEFRRINIEDLRGAGTWIGTLLNPLNTFNEGVYNLLNKQLVVGENVNGMTFTTTFTTKSTYLTGDEFVPILFNYTGAVSPKSCLIGSIVQTSPAAIIKKATSLDWSLNVNVNPKQVTINYISGLLASTTYTLTVIAL